MVNEAIDHCRGVHRKFTVDAFVAAYLLTPMLSLSLRQTNVTAVVGLVYSQRVALGCLKDFGKPVGDAECVKQFESSGCQAAAVSSSTVDSGSSAGRLM